MFTLLSTYFELNYAFWWYLPIFIGAVIVGGTTIAVLSGPQKTTGKTLGVLGMTQSGKSSFLVNLGIIDRLVQGTTMDSYKEKTIKIGDRTITIQQGEDIGGGEVYVKEYYKKWINSKDIIIFVFDGVKYLKQTEYKKDVQARLFFIYNQFMQKNNKKDQQEQINELKNVVVIASHLDEFMDEFKSNNMSSHEMEETIANTIKDKPYRNLLVSNFFSADLRQKSESQSIAYKIF